MFLLNFFASIINDDLPDPGAPPVTIPIGFSWLGFANLIKSVQTSLKAALNS